MSWLSSAVARIGVPPTRNIACQVGAQWYVANDGTVARSPGIARPLTLEEWQDRWINDHSTNLTFDEYMAGR